MPELPEVETIRRWLDAGFGGSTLTGVDIRHHAISLPGLALPETIEGVERWGKELALRLQDRWLAIHLRLTGDLVLGAHEKARLVLQTDRGALSLVDARRLARVRLTDAPPELGPDALDAPPDGDALARAFAGKRRVIKAALLDQALVAGIGNIWVDEILFQARVHPKTQCQHAPAAAIAEAIAELMPRITALVAKDITAAAHGIEWVRHEGQDSALPTRVHLREGEPCQVCQTRIEKLKVSGRGSYVCPRCQPAPWLIGPAGPR